MLFRKTQKNIKVDQFIARYNNVLSLPENLRQHPRVLMKDNLKACDVISPNVIFKGHPQPREPKTSVKVVMVRNLKEGDSSCTLGHVIISEAESRP